MTHPNTSLRLRGRRLRKLAGAFCVASALVAGACVAPPPAAPTTAHSGTPSPSADPGESHTSSYGPPDAPKGAHPDKPLFADWPKDQKPDAVIVFSGQTFGYLQPCGCSRPQTGGLERRFMLVESLKEKGWPVVGVGLGSAHAEKAALAQGLRTLRMSSGAFHDAQFMAGLCPAGMIFVPCRGGVSHHPSEYSSPAQLAAGTRVLTAVLAALASR